MGISSPYGKLPTTLEGNTGFMGRTIAEVEKKTAERFRRREQNKAASGAFYVARAEGKAFCELLLPALADFMLSRKAPAPPRGPATVVRQLDRQELALVALSPLLHHIAVGPKRDDNWSAARVKLAMGRVLYGKLLIRRLLRLSRSPKVSKKDRAAYRRALKAANKHR